MPDTHDDGSGGAEAAMLTAIRRRALTASTYAEWHQVGRDIETLGQKLAAATARAEKAEATLVRFGIVCCACATTDNLGYRNYRDQLLCWPCANGEPKAVDAPRGGLSATETDDGASQASVGVSTPVRASAGPSERCPCGCPKIGDGCNCHFCNEPYPTHQPDDNTTEQR